MNLCDFYIESKGKTPEEAFKRALKTEEKVRREDSHTGSILEKSEFGLVEDTPEDVREHFRAAIEVRTGHEYFRMKVERGRFRKTPKKTRRDKAYAIAYALVSLEDERFYGKEKPAGAIMYTKGNYLFFGFAQE